MKVSTPLIGRIKEQATLLKILNSNEPIDNDLSMSVLFEP
jgi:hypothetical protein